MVHDPITPAWSGSFSAKDRRPIYEWALDYVKLSPPLTRTGPFDVSSSRHFIAIFDALKDDARREVNVLKPVRGGGTLIADVWCPWTRENDAGPFMFVLQTDRIADDHADKVLWPTLESVPGILSKIQSQDRHAKTGRKIHFADGNDIHCNGPSTGNLQTNAFCFIVEDECWMWEPGKIGEADGRVGDYLRLARSKILRISQGGPLEGIPIHEDDWNRVFHEAEVWEWEIECPSCHKRMLPMMSGQRLDGSFWGLTWDRHKLPNGDWDIAKAVPTARFQCEHCPHPLIDGARTKQEWNRTGGYRLETVPNRKKASFHWPALVDYPWDELVELWLNACNAFTRGDPGPKLQFYHKRLAQFMDLERLMRSGVVFTKVAYEVNSDWSDELARYLSIDRQEKDVFWWMVRSWSKEKTRRLAFGRAFSFGELEKIRCDWKVRAERTFCDSKFAPKGDNGVYAACARYGWRAVQGDGQHREYLHSKYVKRPVMRSYSEGRWVSAEIGDVGPFKGRCPLIFFAKSRLNSKVQELIDSGRWEEPATGDAETEKEYAAQMASRVRRTEYKPKTNEVNVYWWEGKNDHARDLSNQQVLGALIDNLISDPATEQLTRSEAAKPVDSMV